MPTTDINDACLPLREKWNEISSQFAQRSIGKYLVLTTVYRTPTEQFELYKKGRKELSPGNWMVEDKSQVVTNVDGYKNIGAHNYNPSRAIDVAVIDNETGKALWEENYYQPLLEIASGVGLESGGSWHSIKDWPHIQIPNFKDYTGS